jgi:endoglucanase
MPAQRFTGQTKRETCVDDAISLLKSLTEAPGISGYEGPVREVTRSLLSGLGELSRDNVGSLICRKAGSNESPRVMLAGHLDEIGFMVKHITAEGFIRFLPLGGWFDQVLLGQRVTIQTHQGDVVGVIGVKPPHMLTAEDRKKVVEKKDMYIDIGAVSVAEVEAAGVRVGDPVVPRCDFQVMANGKSLLSKAFDDRVGVAVMVAVLRALQTRDHPNTVFGAATVMEEVGIRGAATSVEMVHPNAAIILEADIAGDVPGVKPEESTVKLGGGPSLLVYDARMIPNLAFRDLVIETAANLEIPVQLSTIEGGATDGGIIHLHKGGVPTIVIGVPSRHIHSHSSILHLDDFERTVRLVTELVRRLDAQTVERLIP